MALVKAKFVAASTKEEIPVHFNPSEYSISVSPAAGKDEKSTAGSPTIGVQGVETLDLTLHFDTYTRIFSIMDPETFEQSLDYEDVRYYTEPIARLIRREDDENAGLVSFVWGSLNFTGTVTSVSQSFTMFLDDGKPVRAQLKVNMKRTGDMNATFEGTGQRALPDLTDQSWKSVVRDAVKAGKLRDIL